jgi:hypothetical protein
MSTPRQWAPLVLGGIAFYVVLDRILTIDTHGIRSVISKWQHKRQFPRFYGTKPMPPLPQNSNTLILFHGKTDGIGCYLLSMVDAEREWVYMVDRSESKQPDICADLTSPSALSGLRDMTFDKIVVPNCACCTNEIALYRGADFIRSLYRLLKPRGKLYIRDLSLYKRSVNPISAQILNALGLRGYAGGSLCICDVHCVCG